jgi:hypothetical protein
MKFAQVIGIHLDENAWIELLKASMRLIEALWKEDDPPLFSHHPLRGKGASYDSLPDRRTGSRPGPTNIFWGTHL